MNTGRDLVTRLQRSTLLELNRALASMSALVKQPLRTLVELRQSPTLQSAWQGMAKVLAIAPVELMVHEPGQLTCEGHEALGADPDPEADHIGRVLLRHGVRALSVQPGLEEAHLSRFIFELNRQRRHGDPDQDLVTAWYEHGEPTIQLVQTVIPRSYHLDPRSPGADLFNAPPSRLRARAMSGSLDLWQGLERGSEVSTRTVARCLPLESETRVMLDMLFQPIVQETLPQVRNRYASSLLAVMGALEPVLSTQELSFLFNQLIEQQLLQGDYDETIKTTRHVEHFLERTARVNNHTRQVASAIIERLRSPRLLATLARSLSEASRFRVPGQLARWLIPGDPHGMWERAVAMVDEEALPFLIALFQVIYPFDHVFWREALTTLAPERRQVAERAISQFGHTAGPEFEEASHFAYRVPSSPGFVSPETGPSQLPRQLGVRSKSGGVRLKGDDMNASPPGAHDADSNETLKSWDAFDLDSLVMDEDEEMAALDAELAAFLNETETLDKAPTRAPTSELQRRQNLPENMLRSLEALERDLGVHPTLGSGNDHPRGGSDDEGP